MVGDFEKLLVKGETVTMYVMGAPFLVKVMDIDITDYERKYLLAFSDDPLDIKWVNNVVVRQFQFLN
jgi:hypothetical protein